MSFIMLQKNHKAPYMRISAPAANWTLNSGETLSMNGTCEYAISVEVFASINGGMEYSLGIDVSVEGGLWSIDHVLTLSDLGNMTLRFEVTDSNGVKKTRYSSYTGVISAPLPSGTFDVPSMEWAQYVGTTLYTNGTCFNATDVRLYADVGAGWYQIAGTTPADNYWACTYLLQEPQDVGTMHLIVTISGPGGEVGVSGASGVVMGSN